VIWGEGCDQVSAMVWLAPEHAGRCIDGQPDAGLRSELHATLERLAVESGSSASRVEWLLVLTEPADLDAGEITDKGYVNQRAVRQRRAAALTQLTGPDPAPGVIVRCTR
jgi:feruloyl-CoA synthase